MSGNAAAEAPGVRAFLETLRNYKVCAAFCVTCCRGAR